jgi:hypothetical protein
MPIDKAGLGGKIADTLNAILDLESTLLTEFSRVAEAVGKEGRINQRVDVPGAVGGWASMTGHMNGLVGDLVQPMSEMSRVLRFGSDPGGPGSGHRRQTGGPGRREGGGLGLGRPSPKKRTIGPMRKVS